MNQETSVNINHKDMLKMTAQVVTAYVGNNNISGSQISDLVKSVYTSLSGLNNTLETSSKVKKVPAIAVKRSIRADYLICLEDGKKLKMLKRHLRTTYGLSPDQYRLRWGLKSDYPMVAPNYAKQRSAFAKKIGLGKKTPTNR
jgi:predicted transcriptional regulator|tara:strand:- start:8082 stop:8510 length:429 start_codon:yes stop_codon:yes gene_type:complete